jgi:hypothetical protein
MRLPITRLARVAALALAVASAGTALAAEKAPPLEAAVRADRDALLRDVYAARGFAPLWSGTPDAAARRGLVLALLAREQRLGGGPGPAADKLGRAFDKGAGGRPADAELGLTRAALAYLARRAGGRPVRAAAALRLVADPALARASGDLAVALHELRIVDALGGWQPVRIRPTPSVVIPPLTPMRPELELVPPPAERPRPLPEVAGLRRRLVQSFDLAAAQLEGADEMDAALRQAVERFQDRHGLLPDGVVGTRTLAALNRGTAAQVRQVETNIARAQAVAGRGSLPRYLEVNVPAYDLRLVEAGEPPTARA